ncbi:Serine/arginine repetitive matrix protein 4 [Anabarilius grahami]|uniref:Serine/arginine repetitive matrix protein 4 n=1 Tax=Anabarilius grahami TaxID=495550 RepID=A0A3N0XGX5_ANAGA|nr:Serine/arginine repetitive matrix protein 4 [Anabarilius grahami]
MAGVLQGEKQLFEKFWKGTFKAVAMPRPESIIVASITARRAVTNLGAPDVDVDVYKAGNDSNIYNQTNVTDLTDAICKFSFQDHLHSVYPRLRQDTQTF